MEDRVGNHEERPERGGNPSIYDMDIKAFVDHLLAIKPGSVVSAEVYAHLPPIFEQFWEYCENDRQKDMLLLSFLGVSGALMDKVTSEYRNRDIYPNLFIIIIAPAASGKAYIKYPAFLSTAMDRNSFALLDGAIAKKGKNEVIRKVKLWRMAGDSSSAALKEQLQINDGTGYILESEIDTLTQALGKDFGGFSDVLRLTAENEPITKLRLGEVRPLMIENPRFGLVLSGTPMQLSGLIESGENGLFSRCLFYTVTENKEWEDWDFESDKPKLTSLQSIFEKLGSDLIKKLPGIGLKVSLEKRSMQELNTIGKYFDNYYGDNEAMKSAVFRGITQALKITAILTVWRNVDNLGGFALVHSRQATHNDFRTAMCLVGLSLKNGHNLLQNAMKVKVSRSNRYFFSLLPDGAEFATQTAIEIGMKTGMAERTVKDALSRMEADGALFKVRHGIYSKEKPVKDREE